VQASRLFVEACLRQCAGGVIDTAGSSGQLAYSLLWATLPTRQSAHSCQLMQVMTSKASSPHYSVIHCILIHPTHSRNYLSHSYSI